ncbi:hypothetical protein DKP79_26515, partial [Klebsiella pneumoniae]
RTLTVRMSPWRTASTTCASAVPALTIPVANGAVVGSSASTTLGTTSAVNRQEATKFFIRFMLRSLFCRALSLLFIIFNNIGKSPGE